MLMMGDDPLNGYKRGWKQAKGSPKISNDPNRSKMPASYNLIRLGEVVQNSEKAIEWCKEQGLLPSNRDCWNSRQPMAIRCDRGIGSFRCRRTFTEGFCGYRNNRIILRWKNCAATEGRLGMVFATRWPCLVSAAVVPLDMPSFLRSGKNFFRE